MISQASNRYVCWRSNEVHPYESVWSLLNKFCRWNCVSYAEVWELIALNTQPCPSRERYPLAHPTWIDRQKLSVLLKVDSVSDAFTERYFPQKHERLVDSMSAGVNVRFCPKCVARGFHSPLHDLLFIPQCPVHRVPLLMICPKCSHHIDKSLPRISNHDPYGCRCGHLFWSMPKSPAFTDDEKETLRYTVSRVDAIRPKQLYDLGGQYGSMAGQNRLIQRLSISLGITDTKRGAPSK